MYSSAFCTLFGSPLRILIVNESYFNNYSLFITTFFWAVWVCPVAFWCVVPFFLHLHNLTTAALEMMKVHFLGRISPCVRSNGLYVFIEMQCMWHLL